MNARLADAVGEQIQDPARPAAQVDHPPRLGDPNPVKQQLAVDAQLARLTPEPVTFRRAAAERVQNAGCCVIPRAHRAGHTAMLPSFSILDPDFITQSQENPQNIVVGEALLAQVVRALGSSPLWEKSVLLVMYDEHGG